MENKSGPKKRFRTELDRFLIFLIGFFFDTLMGIAVFAASLLFAWVLGLARSSGWGTPEHLKAFDDAHFCLNFGVFLTICIALTARACMGLWKHESDLREAFTRSWTRFRIFLDEFSFDTLRGLTLVGALVLFARVIVLSRAHGRGPEEHLKHYELVYFWATYAIFCGVGLTFLVRMWKGLWEELT